MFTKLRNNISQMQMIALGFFCIILIGTLLLMTPLASRAGTWTDFLTALFTSTSATCVTGLVVTNTYLHWSLFGQIIIITLIQIGGLLLPLDSDFPCSCERRSPCGNADS